MAVAYDTTVATKYSSDISMGLVAWSHTMSATSNGVIFIAMYWRLTAITLSSIQYNSQNMTLVNSITNAAGNGGIVLYGYFSPASGAHNCAVDFGINAYGNIIFASFSFTGVDQKSWYRDYKADADTGVLPSLTIAGETSDISVLVASQNSSTGDTLWTETSPQTRMHRNTFSVSSNGLQGDASYKTGANPSTVSIASGTSRANRQMAFSLMPPQTGAGYRSFCSW